MRGIRRESKKHAAQREERREVVRAAFARDRGTCQANLIGSRCSGPLDPHEIIPRSAWRGGYLVLANVIIVCRTHHDWIDDHPDIAHALGLHGYSWEIPQGPVL